MVITSDCVFASRSFVFFLNIPLNLPIDSFKKKKKSYSHIYLGAKTLLCHCSFHILMKELSDEAHFSTAGFRQTVIACCHLTFQQILKHNYWLYSADFLNSHNLRFCLTRESRRTFPGLGDLLKIPPRTLVLDFSCRQKRAVQVSKIRMVPFLRKSFSAAEKTHCCWFIAN